MTWVRVPAEWRDRQPVTCKQNTIVDYCLLDFVINVQEVTTRLHPRCKTKISSRIIEKLGKNNMANCSDS